MTGPTERSAIGLFRVREIHFNRSFVGQTCGQGACQFPSGKTPEEAPTATGCHWPSLVSSSPVFVSGKHQVYPPVYIRLFPVMSPSPTFKPLGWPVPLITLRHDAVPQRWFLVLLQHIFPLLHPKGMQLQHPSWFDMPFNIAHPSDRGT